MGKRKREDDDDYVDFCSGLQQNSRNGLGDRSYIYSESRRFKRPKINPNFYKPAQVHYRSVYPEEKVYKKIVGKITNRAIVVDELIEVKNSTLEDAYNIKLNQKSKEYGKKVQEELLFHGTKKKNLASICTFNFDWRLNGSNKGHKYGKGVCFSKNAKYASNYSDRHSYNKVMIVAKVLIGEVCQGHHDMSIPPQGYDTSQKGRDGVVMVKYEDNEFFPAYIMYYHFRKRYENSGYCFDNYKTYYDPYSYNNYYNDCYYNNNNNNNNAQDVFYFGRKNNNNRHYKNYYNNNNNYRYNDYFYNSQNCSEDFTDDSYDQTNYYSFN